MMVCDMKDHPIQIQFIIPEGASSASKQRFKYLRKLAEKNGTIHLELSITRKVGDVFEASVRFDDKTLDTTESESNEPKQIKTLELATEDEVRAHALALSKNPLFDSLEPAKRLLALMNSLNKAVRLKTLANSCQDILKLNYDTIRGTLNKNQYGHCKSPLYYSPERGIWRTVGET